MRQVILQSRFFLVLFLFSSCTTLHFSPSSEVPGSPAVSQEKIYDELYPYSVEFCAVSRLNPVQGKRGGSGGHAAMYLTGACLQKDAGYPLLEMCRAQSGEKNEHLGTGVSVDKMFRNVNWIGIQDKALFFGTDLPAGKTLTSEQVQETAQKALKLGFFRGIKLHEKWMEEKPETMSAESWIAEKTLGTDYALAYSRYGECVKIPVTQPMMERIIHSLNVRNEKYFREENYEWSNLSNNCTHVLHNALAATDFVEPKKMNSPVLTKFFNLAVPANEVADLTFLSAQNLPESLQELFEDEKLKKSFEEFEWLPMQPGVLLQKRPLHVKNQVHHTSSEMLMLDWPFFHPRAHRFERFLNDPQNTDLRANLLGYKERYEKLLKKIPADSTNNRYRSYLERQLAGVNVKLKVIES